MDEAQEILLRSLESSGVSIPTGVASTRGLEPGPLISICSQSLHLINDTTPPFPATLPDPMAERVKVCTDIASAVKSSGYRGELSFHQFLYPSSEDSYKLVKFLVERLSESSEGRKFVGKKVTTVSPREDVQTADDSRSTSKESLERTGSTVGGDTDQASFGVKDLKRELLVISSTSIGDVYDNKLVKDNVVREPDYGAAGLLQSSSQKSCDGTDLCGREGDREPVQESPDSREEDFSVNMAGASPCYDSSTAELEEKLDSPQQQPSPIKYKIEDQRSEEEMLLRDADEKALKDRKPEDEHELLKAAMEIAFEDQHPVGNRSEDLNKKVDARRQKPMELESQWGVSKKSSEKDIALFKQTVHDQIPETEMKEKRQRLAEVEQEVEATILEIRKSEEQLSKLNAEIERLPKIASRKSYIQRVIEITKNSRKQDADIEKIIHDTRELQMESNSIQERLHRTYAVVDETIFRDTKNDPVRRQAYRLLTSIHDSFEQISDKILATDRLRRESTEQEAKLAAITSRSFDIRKLQADLDAIGKENEFLEQQLKNNCF